MDLAALAALGLALSLAGCAQPGEDAAISHVHGLAYEPTQGAVYVATHNGLAKGVLDQGAWSWEYVGNDRYDYMGFTQDAEQPGVFYSSGHPDRPHAYGGVHLGLRRSMDAGETWEQRSLKGEVDFHALTSIPGQGGWLAGYWQGVIKVSEDRGATWRDHPAPPAQVLALAGTTDRLLAGTTAGLYEARDLAQFDDWTLVQGEATPSFVSAIATSPDGQALFASARGGGAVHAVRSVDGGASWTAMQAPALEGATAPVVFAVDPHDAHHVFASTAQGGVMGSTDQGETWTTIRAA